MDATLGHSVLGSPTRCRWFRQRVRVDRRIAVVDVNGRRVKCTGPGEKARKYRWSGKWCVCRRKLDQLVRQPKATIYRKRHLYVPQAAGNGLGLMGPGTCHR